MAKTNGVDTLANLFAARHSMFVIEAGPNNTKDVDGAKYRFAVPKSYTDANGALVDMASNATAYALWVSNNWEGSRYGFKGKSLEEKRAWIADPAKNGFVPTVPPVFSPVEMVIARAVAKRNEAKYAGMSDAQVLNDPMIQEAVGIILHDPARTESYIDLCEQEPETLASYMVARSRKSDGSDDDKPVEEKLSF